MIGSQVAFDNLSLEYDGGVRAIDEVTLQVPAGKITAFVGPSGCGKTSILRVVAGLQSPTSGSCQITPNVDARAGEVGFVFQQASLLKWRNVKQNVVLPLELSGSATPRNDWIRRADELLLQVGLL